MTASFPTPGAPTSDFALAVTVSGLEVGPGAGRPMVVVFYTQNAAFAVDRLNREGRGRYPSLEELMVASVVDLSLVPPLFRPSVRMALEASYRQAAAPPDVGSEHTGDLGTGGGDRDDPRGRGADRGNLLAQGP